MPELPEVEVLCRHLAPRLAGRHIRAVQVLIPRAIRPLNPRAFATKLQNATFNSLARRGKHLCFEVSRSRTRFILLGHLGMTGRMYLLPRTGATPAHATIRFDLGREQLVFEDPRRFGRMTFDDSVLMRLGPEPLDPAFTTARLTECLGRSHQAIKVRLMDQSTLAGVGNIYASEVLFEARIDPRRATRSLSRDELKQLHRALRKVLTRAVRCGSTLPLDFSGQDGRDGLFYFGRSAAAEQSYEEQLRVYDHESQPCFRCRGPIRRLHQAGRSTFLCPRCQR